MAMIGDVRVTDGVPYRWTGNDWEVFDEKPVKAWTAAQIREMVDEMMDTDTDDDPFRVSIAHIRNFLASKLGIDMHGRTVRVYDDE